MDPLNAERITLNKQTFPLAADFDAPTALLVARERPERLGLSRVMNPEAYADTAMLTRLQQFDPARTPVIFVHGLQETGASWAPMIDSLRHDPAIRSIISSGTLVIRVVIPIRTPPRSSARILMGSSAHSQITSASS
jgi:hypothetical protein